MSHLLHWGYAGLFGLHAMLLALLMSRRVRETAGPAGGPAESEHSRAAGAMPWGLGAALGLGIFVLALFARQVLPPRPQVYFDEFFYLATARHVQASGTITPLVEQGLPPRPRAEDVLPPYPQGWPLLLAAVPGVIPAQGASFPGAVRLQRGLGALAALAVFGMLASESLVAAAFAGLAMALMPAALRLAQGASAEGASLLFVVLALWACRSQRFRPGPAGALLAALAVAWAVHFRAENFLYLPLFLPLAFVGVRTRPAWGAGAAVLLVVFLAPDAAIMIHGALGPHAADYFAAVPRPGFASMGANAAANLLGNLAFLGGGRILPYWVSGMALLGSIMLWRRGWRLPLAFYWGWILLFIAAFSPFPFGDFQVAHSCDTWRFTLSVTLPLVLLGARGADGAARALPGRALAAALGALLLLAMLGTPYTQRAFLFKAHPLDGLWQALAELAPQLRLAAEGAEPPVVVVREPTLVLLLQEGLGVEATTPPIVEADAVRRAAVSPLLFLTEGGQVPVGWERFPLAYLQGIHVVAVGNPSRRVDDRVPERHANQRAEYQAEQHLVLWRWRGR